MDSPVAMGQIEVPLSGGNLNNIPSEIITMGPNEVNISEEMSKTGIWKNLTANDSSEKIKFR
jgi:hypothetical protein